MFFQFDSLTSDVSILQACSSASTNQFPPGWADEKQCEYDCFLRFTVNDEANYLRFTVLHHNICNFWNFLRNNGFWVFVIDRTMVFSLIIWIIRLKCFGNFSVLNSRNNSEVLWSSVSVFQENSLIELLRFVIIL